MISGKQDFLKLKHLNVRFLIFDRIFAAAKERPIGKAKPHRFQKPVRFDPDGAQSFFASSQKTSISARVISRKVFFCSLAFSSRY